MSEHLKNFRPGIDSIVMKGPKGKLGYLGNSMFSVRRSGVTNQIRLRHVVPFAWHSISALFCSVGGCCLETKSYRSSYRVILP